MAVCKKYRADRAYIYLPLSNVRQVFIGILIGSVAIGCIYLLYAGVKRLRQYRKVGHILRTEHIDVISDMRNAINRPSPVWRRCRPKFLNGLIASPLESSS